MMMKIFFTLFIAATVLADLQVLHPKELKTKLGDDGKIRSSLGNFGHLQYGTSVVSLSFINNVVGKDILPSE